MATGTIAADGRLSRAEERAEAVAASQGSVGALSLSILTGVLLLGALVVIAGPWALLANTRALGLLIGAGVVKYHDRHAGFIEGIPNAEYYLASQDPINWTVLAIVVGAYLLIWALKALQFHLIARHYGVGGNAGQHATAYGQGLLYRETMPFGLGDAAVAAALRQAGAPLERSRAAVLLFNSFLIFELASFALFALVGLGWAAWLTQIIWALAILGVLQLWVSPGRATQRALGGPGLWQARASHAGALLRQPGLFLGLAALSLLSFGLRDVAAYLTAMAFSTQNVLLNIDPSLILMGVVGGYVATLVRVTPGGVGQFEWGFSAALFIGGVGLPEAATVAILVSVFRYSALLLLFLATGFWRHSRASFAEVRGLVADAAWQRGVPASADLPALAAQAAPSSALLWRRALLVAGGALTLFFFDRASLTLSDKWLLESLGLGQVFATNFAMSTILFVIASLGTLAAVVVPALSHRIAPEQRSFIAGLGLVAGLLAGYLMSLRYLDFLLYRGGSVGQADPIFGIDIGFYVFQLPGLWMIWSGLTTLLGTLLLSSLVCAALARRHEPKPPADLSGWLAAVATPTTQATIGLLGLAAAWGFWLSRYNLLVKDSYAASVFVGASHVDVTGLVSTHNQLLLSALVAIGVAAALVVMLRAMAAAARRGQPIWGPPARRAGALVAGLIALDFAFAAGVAIRDTTMVAPNQPVAQLPYIGHHIAATRAAYGMDAIEEIDLRPRADSDPLPDIERLINSPTIRNAPLWPTFVNYIERLVDPQHAERVLLTEGDTMIYGPTMEIFRQKQKLRTYYDFLDVDALRFSQGGETRVYASAVRELPILEPQPWLAWWGQRFMLFTHGHGLVAAPVNEFNAEGEPSFASSAIPVVTSNPALSVVEQQIYYGEGAGSMAVSNVRNMSEFDYPTERDRALNVLPLDSPAGVRIDSPLKRLVFAWRSGEFFSMLFSTLITPETRLHYYRQPIERLEHIAPFLYFDGDPYAFPADGRILWMVNAMTTSDRYPYSMWSDFGDKAVSRSPETIDTRLVNYVEDSVKATIDAATGQVTLYQIADAPLINAWASVYPGLFTDGNLMPAGVRQQLTYPTQLLHTQFDDLYIYYHMNDPMYFFNMEDMWDDSDEVLGPIMDEGEAITFSIEPTHILLETGGALPAASTPTQFAQIMAFTPEGARNLRAVPIVYQDGADYGRLFVLEVPKGQYVVGPEQADSIIDQDPAIAEQIALWNRKGTEVIRGHTTLMLIDNELFYIEPLFIRSKQNRLTQLKQVVTVFRGRAFMAPTLEESLRMAIAGGPVAPAAGAGE